MYSTELQEVTSYHHLPILASIASGCFMIFTTFIHYNICWSRCSRSWIARRVKEVVPVSPKGVHAIKRIYHSAELHCIVSER